MISGRSARRRQRADGAGAAHRVNGLPHQRRVTDGVGEGVGVLEGQTRLGHIFVHLCADSLVEGRLAVGLHNRNERVHKELRERVLQQLGAAGAAGGVGGQEVAHDAAHLGACVGGQIVVRSRQCLLHHLSHRRPLEGALEGQGFVKQNTEREHIGLFAVGAALPNLGRNIIRGPAEGAANFS